MQSIVVCSLLLPLFLQIYLKANNECRWHPDTTARDIIDTAREGNKTVGVEVAILLQCRSVKLIKMCIRPLKCIIVCIITI